MITVFIYVKNQKVAEKIIRDFFSEYIDDDSCIKELWHALYITEIGYWEITEQEIINE